jgi:hypothetical protein
MPDEAQVVEEVILLDLEPFSVGRARSSHGKHQIVQRKIGKSNPASVPPARPLVPRPVYEVVTRAVSKRSTSYPASALTPPQLAY